MAIYIAGMPKVDKNRVRTDKEIKVTLRFLSARAYTEAAMADPERKSFYAKKVSGGNTAFNVASKGFQKKPIVKPFHAPGILTGGFMLFADYKKM